MARRLLNHARSGRHAGRTTWRARVGRKPLCVLMATLLVFAPLPVAYGAGAEAGSGAAAVSAADTSAAGVPASGASPDAAASAGAEDALADEAGAAAADDAQAAADAAGDAAAAEPDAASAGEGATGDAAAAEGSESDAPVAAGSAAEDLGAAGDSDADAAVPGDAATAEASSGQRPLAETAADASTDGVSVADAGMTGANASRVSAASGTAAPATGLVAATRSLATQTADSIALLVVVAGFTGDARGAGAVAYSDSYDWGGTVFESSTGVSSYYYDMSDGMFTFVPAAETSAFGKDGNTNAADAENDGVVHVNLAEAHGNWRGDYDDPQVARAMLATFARALQAASAYVDFASYDADGNGSLETDELAIAFVIAGYEAADAGALPQGAYALWSHAWSYDEAGVANPVVDGVAANEYIAIAESIGALTESGFTTSQEPLSILMHELGHYLGLPDLYDTTGDYGDWSGYSVDNLSLMDSGNWASTTDAQGRIAYTPTALDAWSRYQLGWVSPTVVGESGVYTVSAQGSKDGYTLLLIPTKRKGEYYLIENRSFSGWDAALAETYGDYADGGLVIWHIDQGVVDAYLLPNEVNGSDHRPGVMPLFAEADDETGEYSLAWKGSYPDSAYAFWTRGMFAQLFPGATALDLPLYGAKAKANSVNARLLSGIRIEFLSDAGGTMRIRITMPGDANAEEANEQEAKPATGLARKASYHEPGAAGAAAASAIPDTGDALPIAPLAACLLAGALAALCLTRVRAGESR